MTGLDIADIFRAKAFCQEIEEVEIRVVFDLAAGI
jgi:hypothetical protein